MDLECENTFDAVQLIFDRIIDNNSEYNHNENIKCILFIYTNTKSWNKLH